jgi:uncharacterized repeat protein (TIGR02543 family)
MKRKNVIILVLAVLLLISLLTACVSNVSFKIDFIVDGDVYHTVDSKGNEEIKMPPDPTKDGAIFDGWYWDEHTWRKPFTANSLLNAPLSENMSVYAKWKTEGENEVQTYTITFNSNGGGDISAITKEAGESITEPTAPTKTGYTFDGWYTDNNTFENEYTFSTMPAESFTLYAKWIEDEPQPVTYTITFNSNGGGDISAITKKFGESITAPTAPTRTGYTFGGWYTDNGTFLNGYTFSVMPAESVTLYAKWIYAQPSGSSALRELYEENIDLFIEVWEDGFGEDDLTQEDIPFFDTEDQFLDEVKEVFEVNSIEAIIMIGGMPLAIQFSGAEEDFLMEIEESSDLQMLSDIYGYTYTIDENIIFFGFFSARYIFTGNAEINQDETAYISQDETVLIRYIGSDSTYSIGSGITNIGYGAFIMRDGLISITIPNTVTSIGDGAFYYCSSLTSITIPDSVTSIGDWAFYRCSSLTSITIPDSVTSIGNYAFSGCTGLTSITIPDSVTSIGDRAFSSCSSLTSIEVSVDNINYKSIEGVLFNKAGTELIQYPVGNSKTSYDIPISVTSIGNYAFSGCTGLTSITIPDSVTSIGDWAFYYCSSLTSITIPDSVTSIGDEAFSYCSSLTSITIPDSVTSIGDWAFYGCSSLTIYAEAVSRPDGWNEYWNPDNRPVVWGHQGENAKYTITFNSNGGGDISAITKEAGESITAPTAPTKTGYTFDGWYTDDDTFLDEYTFSTMPAESFTLYAKWIEDEPQPETYTITFNSNGGGDISAITKEAGESITAPTAPTRDYYTFNGWYTDDGTFSNAYTFTTMPADNITVFAKWTINQYTISFNSNGGSEVTAITQDYGTEVDEPAEPTKEGYTFNGWYTDDGTLSTAYTFTTMPADNITVFAKWTINQYTISFNSNGGSEVTAITQDYGTEVDEPAEPTKAGYTFDGWYTDDDTFLDEYTFSTMPAESFTLYAKWIEDEYTRINASGEPAVDGDYILFGEYPQTIKANNITVGTSTDTRGYYLGSDDCYYAKVTATPYSSGYTFSTSATVTSGTVYYFKVEPIKWRILSEESGGTALILCESIIANKRYAASSNNYMNSEIRAWLNDEFYNTAFNTLQQELIQITEVDNSVYSTGYSSNSYACANTNDKIFLPSYREMVNTAYGFSRNSSDYDTARRRLTSDYSRATGAYMSTDTTYYGNGSWWLRSPYGSGSDYARRVRNNGYIGYSYDVNITYYGVVPALVISLP